MLFKALKMFKYSIVMHFVIEISIFYLSTIGMHLDTHDDELKNNKAIEGFNHNFKEREIKYIHTEPHILLLFSFIIFFIIAYFYTKFVQNPII